MKNKIIYSTIGILLISITIAVISLNDIYKVNENIDIDLDSNVKTWCDNEITNAKWIGDSLEVIDDNMFSQKFYYEFKGQNFTEKHKLINDYQKASLYCKTMGDEICLWYEGKDCILWGEPECIEWDNYDIEPMLSKARKQKTEKIYNKIYSGFNKQQPLKIDTGDKIIT